MTLSDWQLRLLALAAFLGISILGLPAARENQHAIAAQVDRECAVTAGVGAIGAVAAMTISSVAAGPALIAAGIAGGGAVGCVAGINWPTIRSAFHSTKRAVLAQIL